MGSIVLNTLTPMLLNDEEDRLVAGNKTPELAVGLRVMLFFNASLKARTLEPNLPACQHDAGGQDHLDGRLPAAADRHSAGHTDCLERSHRGGVGDAAPSAWPQNRL